jgi:hypothetical protein
MAQTTTTAPTRGPGRPRVRPEIPGDPEVSRTFKLQSSIWFRLKHLALMHGTTATDELRALLDQHLPPASKRPGMRRKD